MQQYANKILQKNSNLIKKEFFWRLEMRYCGDSQK